MKARLVVLSFLLLLVSACGGGGGGGGGPTPPPPIQPPNPQPRAPSAATSGVVGAAAGSGVARILCALPGTGFQAALFQGASQGTTYSTGPVAGPLADESVTISGLSDGTDVFFGLGIRAVGGTTWTPVGSVVRLRPSAPIYVDAAANPVGANGLAPATAFPHLLDALLVAGAQNGGNVWVRAGTYAAGPYPLGPNTHAAGGFDGTFLLSARNAATNATLLSGSSTQEIVSVLSGGGDGTLDGFVVDGGNAVLKGIDIVDSDVELRDLVVRRCLDRGIKAVTTTPAPNRRLVVIASTVTGNGSDGLGAAGPIDVSLDLSDFDANGQEGADLDDLEAPDGGAVSLFARGCRFFGNVFEGLDVDLASAPLAAGAGTFDVYIENCRFEVNGLDGLLIDQEHEAAPGFAARIVVRGCLMRANRGAGLHIDADARGTYTLDRLRCTANAGDGVLITSETHAGEVLLTASWLGGNLGAGARVASGNKVLVASHCAFTGNQNGGLRGDVGLCAVANSVFLRQTAPRTNTSGAGNVDTDGATAVFVNAPVAFATVSAASQGTLNVAGNSGFAAGTSVAAADDGVRLVVNQSSATALVLDRAPSAFVAPGMVAAYAGTDVIDDAVLAAGSAAAAAGIGAAGTTLPAAGPIGAPVGGPPGRSEPFTTIGLHLLSVSPPLSTGVGALAPIVLTFDRPLDLASINQDRIVVLQDGSPVAANVSASGATLTIAPTAPGFSGSVTVRLLGGLVATDGSPLGAALLLPIRLL